MFEYGDPVAFKHKPDMPLGLVKKVVGENVRVIICGHFPDGEDTEGIIVRKSKLVKISLGKCGLNNKK